MNKKGVEIGVNLMVILLFSLIVVGIAIVMVRQQITKGGERVGALGEEAELQQNKCTSFVLQQQCADKTTCPEGFETVPPPPGGWIDDNCMTCCRRT